MKNDILHYRIGGNMRTALFTLLALLLFSSTLVAQDGSVETFNAIRLEHSSNPGSSITLSAPTGTTSYSLIFPATGPSTSGRRHSFSLSGSGNSMSWYKTPLGSSGQLPFFENDEDLTGSPSLLWNNTTKQLTVSSTSNSPMMRLVKDANVTADDVILEIDATYSSSGNADVDVRLIDFGFDGSALGNGSSVTALDIDIIHSPSSTAKPSKATGLKIDVTGADTNVAAIINGGFVGVNTEYPQVYLDVAGDVAMREYNFTGNLATVNDNVDFDGEGNRHSFIRVASNLSAAVRIDGLKGGYDGKIIKLYNATSQSILLAHEGSNQAGNNITTGANADVLLLPGNTYELIYSGTEQNWIVAFSGPGELAQLGNKSVSISAQNETLPSSVSSYIQITTPDVNSINTYDVALEDGTTPGQILVVQNKGPKKIAFETTNAVWDNSTDLQTGESIILVWNGDSWVQVARASN